jgi:hypothetical protein
VPCAEAALRACLGRPWPFAHVHQSLFFAKA